jgi:hypothetical protein
MRLVPLVPLLASVLALAACGESDGASCLTAKCDDLAGLTSRLEGRNDPIAKLLRAEAVPEDGVMKADYEELILALAAQQGCTPDSWKTFVLSDHLLEGEPFPRLIATVCSGDVTRASEIFVAASFKDPDADDIDPYNIEAFAWDAEAAVYRFYAAPPHGDDAIVWDVEPERCAKCHLTPKGLPSDGMGMTPIMNELTQPWAHWNSQVPMFNAAGTPFPSHTFEFEPIAVKDAPGFTRFARQHPGAATEFEQIVRAGHARVTNERVRARRNTAADWRPAMNLLRPVFCDEQVNYTTEDFGTGLIHVTSLVPGGAREAFRAIRAEPWPWPWANNADGRVRLPPPASLPPLFMFPVRGAVDVEYETRMVGARALDPMQILRVRALDWKRPVMSELRCGLWTRALAQFEATPPELDLSGRVVNHLPVLFEKIMQVGGVSLITDPSTLIAIDQVATRSQTAMAAQVEAAKQGAACAPGVACVVSVEAFGGLLDAHVQSFVTAGADEARQRLVPLRDEMLCAVSKVFESTPALPPIVCP